MSKAQQRDAITLYNLLVDANQTYETVCADTGWHRSYFYKVVSVLRKLLAAEDDTLTVIADPPGKGEPWVYRLSDGGQAIDPENSGWLPNRMRDMESRAVTLANFAEIAVNATNGRTVLGRKARVFRLHLTRVLEELQLINDE